MKTSSHRHQTHLHIARQAPRTAHRAFTLVELMIVIAIIGVLAALAIYGLRSYLASSKAAEAKRFIGIMSRAAHAAFERELAPPEMLDQGSVSSGVAHQLCDTAIPVPAAVPQGTKYQPSSAPGDDFQTGDSQTGWMCLGFTVTQAIYYQLRYTRGACPAAPDNPAACSGDGCYEAAALGDLDGDGTFSRLALTGQVNPATGALREATNIYVQDESE